MRTAVHTGIIFFLCLAVNLSAQERDPLITGEFRDVPFTEFAAAVEQQAGLRFYYLDTWVSGIRITASGTDLSLRKILDRALRPVGIHYYLDVAGNIYLTYDQTLAPVLPDYGGKGSGEAEPEHLMGNGEITGAEQRYIEGHSTGMLETLEVGDPQKAGSREGVVIHGRMLDAETSEPLIGATIYVEGLKKGASTDVDGHFSIILRPGKHRVTFNCMGMEPMQNNLQVYSGGDLTIRMKKGLIPITEVVVKADRFHNVRGSQMGFERLNYQTTKEVPVVLGEKDLLKIAQMLPGVQSVGEGSAGFNVRGGSADQNMIYVNRVPVYNSSHLFGFFTSFSPDIVKDFSMYKSNLPAAYGGRLSSIFDISTRQGNMNRYTARGGISPITGHIAAEGPIIRDKVAFVLSARSTYSDWILRRLEDPQLRESNAFFYDLSGTVTAIPDEKNLIKAFGYYSSDAFSLGTTNHYAYANAGASLSLKHRFGTRMTGDLALVFGQYAFSTQNMELESESYSHDYRIDHYELKTDLTWLSLGRHRVTYGAGGIFYDLHRGIAEPWGENSLFYPVDLGRENGVELAAYVADEITLDQRLTAYLGFRYSAFLNPVSGDDQTRYQGPEPRLSLTWLVGPNHSVKASYNRLHQYILMLNNTFAISPTDQWKLADDHLLPPVVDQYSLGYYQELSAVGINASAEFYYKDYAHVLEYKDGADFIKEPDTETQVVQGDQDAWGLELMVRKNTGKLNGWLSYCYSRSMMLFMSSIPGEEINEGQRYPSNYDRPHNLNLVANYKLNRRLSLSATLVYITGRPITYPVSIYYRDGVQFLDYSQRNQYRIPDYFRTDLSINLEGNLKRKKLAHSFWMLSFYNLTGRHNAYSVYFRNEEGEIRGYKLSIFGRPVITLSWNFKFGNYASE
jgi:hypothetical protein